MGCLAAKFSDLMGPSLSLPPLLPPYSSHLDLATHADTPSVRKKAILADVVFRWPMTTHLGQEVLGHLRLFINASLDCVKNSADIAATIPALGYKWCRWQYQCFNGCGDIRS